MRCSVFQFDAFFLLGEVVVSEAICDGRHFGTANHRATSGSFVEGGAGTTSAWGKCLRLPSFLFKTTFQPLPFHGASWYQRKVKRWNQESDSMNICGDIVVMFNWKMTWSLMKTEVNIMQNLIQISNPCQRTEGGWVGLWNCGILLNTGEFHCHSAS